MISEEYIHRNKDSMRIGTIPEEVVKEMLTRGLAGHSNKYFIGGLENIISFRTDIRITLDHKKYSFAKDDFLHKKE